MGDVNGDKVVVSKEQLSSIMAEAIAPFAVRVDHLEQRVTEMPQQILDEVANQAGSLVWLGCKQGVSAVVLLPMTFIKYVGGKVASCTAKKPAATEPAAG